MKNTKWWLGCMVALAGAGMAAGTEITLEQAETAVGNWLARGGAFGVLASNAEVSGETYEDTDTGARMHVVRIPGKGFAVTSTDDGIEPIIFFSDGDSDAGFIPEEGNPMWDLLRWDLAARMMEQERNVDGKIARITAKDGEGTTQKKWKDLLETDMQVARRNATKATVNTKSSISDIRRDRILGTKWGQREVKLGATLHPAYNFYTPPDAPPVAKAIARNSPPTKDLQPDETNEANPVHYPCGCVATAGGQLMRKWGYPAAPKERKTVGCSLDGKSIQLTMQGGPYRWGNMGEKVPATPAQCEAVGRVLYDIGVACGASYEDAEHGGTGMQTADLVKNLRTVFGYKSATYFGTAFYESEGSVLDRLKKIAIPNLDAKAPILLDIKRARFNEKINHAVVADGYGYDNGNFSLHVNFGWNGKGNGWYVPPSFHPDPEYDYDFIRGVAGNIFPNKEGVVASGRAEGAHGRPVSGVEVRLCTPSGDVLQAKTTGIDGVYWFMEEPGTYVVQVGVGSTTTEGSLVLTECGDDAIGNAIQDWMLPSVLTVADISKVPETVSPAARGAEDSTVFAPFEVRLTNSTPGAEIRYTLDGTQPTPESDFYEEPIPIQDTTTLRAVGYADGMECSEEFTKTWIFEDPSNRDQFADARPLLGSSSRATFSNTGYTKEPEEPLHSSDGFAGGASVWATWTAPADGDWTFWLEGTSDSEDSDELDTQLAVYTGASVGELVRVSSNDDTPAGGTSSRVSIHAEKGVEYKIAMDTRGGGGGTLTLRWEEGYIHYARFKVERHHAERFVPQSGMLDGIPVESSINWRLVEHSDWVTPKTAEGANGDVFACALEANGTGMERTGYVTIQTEDSEPDTLALRQHPMDFVTTKEAAIEQAWRENKRILLIQGVEASTSTSDTLFSSVPAVKELIDEKYVLWYSNYDRQKDASGYASGIGSYTFPLVCILDPQNMDTCVARTTGAQSVDDLQSFLAAHATWSGVPNARMAMGQMSPSSVTVTTHVRAWGTGASSATVTLETSENEGFSSVASSRKLGTVKQIWTAQDWTFELPPVTNTTFFRVRVSSGDWSQVSDVVGVLPDGVTHIADHAFQDCTNLVFVAMPASVTHIGSNAFCNCSALASLAIPPGMQRMERDAFTGCSGLAKVDIRDLDAWCRVWFCNSNANPLYFAKHLYVNGEEVEDLVIPESVTSLGFGVFYGCNGLETATIPDTVTEIGRSAFAYCRGLTTVTIDTGVVYIGLYAFRGCSGLTSLTIPDSVTHLENDVFNGCSGLTTLSVPGAWEGTDMLANAGVPEGCKVVYRSPLLPATSMVTLDRQGGQGGTGVVEATFGMELPAIVPPEREGYSFGGYWSSPGGKGIQYCDAEGNTTAVWNRIRNATIYAMWTPRKYTATFYIPGENGNYFWYSTKVTFGEMLELPSTVTTSEGTEFKVATPTRDRYDFGGYWTETDGTGVQYFSETGKALRPWDIAENATLYAHWRERRTTGTPVPVTYSWLEEHAPSILSASGGDYEKAATALAANGLPVWKCYLAGLSTTNAEEAFKVKSISFVGGAPVVEWSPNLNENGTKTNRAYHVEGKPTLTNEWAPADENSRFFRVRVELPPQE